MYNIGVKYRGFIDSIVPRLHRPQDKTRRSCHIGASTIGQLLTCSDFRFSVGDSLEMSGGNPVDTAEADDTTQTRQFSRVWRGDVN